MNMLRRNMEDKREQIKHLEMKTTVSEMKNTLCGINDRIDTEEKIGELENIANIQSKTQIEKNTLKVNRVFFSYVTTSNSLIYV